MDGGEMEKRISTGLHNRPVLLESAPRRFTKPSLHHLESTARSAFQTTSIVSLRDHIATMVFIGTPPEAQPLANLFKYQTQFSNSHAEATAYSRGGCCAVCMDLGKFCAFVVLCLVLILMVECLVYLIYLFCFRLPPINASTFSERVIVTLVLLFKQLYNDII
ncbi:unnamed protein product [Toxocara canis]|uniref:Uncharacterized protein n=1 Tax=Toxocara canis TaxID=6265 RepID=A0A183TYK7_TOXCA|nr:unnamed protein product [Toxocara canis]